MKKIITTAALLGLAGPAHAGSQALGPVFWVKTDGSCQVLASPSSVQMSNGPSGVRLSLRPGRVSASNRGCGSVQGATVVATGTGSGSVSYTVTYSNGQTSSHNKQVNLH